VRLRGLGGGKGDSEGARECEGRYVERLLRVPPESLGSGRMYLWIYKEAAIDDLLGNRSFLIPYICNLNLTRKLRARLYAW
jgi:hypothetical protein